MPHTWGPEVRKLEFPSRSSFPEVTVSSCGSLLASGASTSGIQLWDANTGKLMHELGVKHSQHVFGLVFSPCASMLASAMSSYTKPYIQLWDIETGQQLFEFNIPYAYHHILSFSTDSALFVSITTDTAQVWSVKTGLKVASLHKIGLVLAAKFLSDGSLFATVNSLGLVSLWDIQTGQKKLQLHLHSCNSNLAVFSPDGFMIASQSTGTTIRMWATTSGKQTQHFVGQTSKVTTLEISPDNSILASVSSDDYLIRLWSVSSGELTQVLGGHKTYVGRLAFLPYSSMLVSASSDQTVRLWDTSMNSRIQTAEKPTSLIKVLEFAPSGSIIASGTEDGVIQLWSAMTGLQIRTFGSHKSPIGALTFSSDDSTLASASTRPLGIDFDLDEQPTIRLWDVETGRELECISCRPDIRALHFESQSKNLRVSTIDRLNHRWNSKTPYELIGIRAGPFQRKFEPPYVDLGLWDDWILHRDRRFLWLPFEYRGKVSAVHGAQIAVASFSGQVNVFRIQDD